MTFVPEVAHAAVGGGNDKGDPSRMSYVAATVSAKWAKGSGGPAGDEAQNLVSYAPEVSATIAPGSGLVEGLNGQDALNVVVTAPAVMSHAQRNHPDEEAFVVTHALRSEGADGSEDGTGRGTPLVSFRSTGGTRSVDADEDTAPSLMVGSGLGIPSPPAVAQEMDASVRRLTPTECERLQGFPDGWTSGQSDSVRYRQLGNAVCVPVAEWLARRLAAVPT